MKEKGKKWWLVLIKGIILIAIGLYVFGHPVDALLGVAYFIGIGFLLTGIVVIVLSISTRKESKDWGWKLAEGILDIAFAFILLKHPGITATTLPFILGIWTIVYGIMTFAGSFQAKDDGYSDWWLSTLGGIAAVILGYFITANFSFGTFTITFWIGLAFVVLGVFNTIIAIKAMKVKKEIEG
jgi:uncharacterized membrane protein HdeD (DUF308 family)